MIKKIITLLVFVVLFFVVSCVKKEGAPKSEIQPGVVESIIKAEPARKVKESERFEREYIVQKGDVLSVILNEYMEIPDTWNDVGCKPYADYNNMKSVRFIYPGDVIKIPYNL